MMWAAAGRPFAVAGMLDLEPIIRTSDSPQMKWAQQHANLQPRDLEHFLKMAVFDQIAVDSC